EGRAAGAVPSAMAAQASDRHGLARELRFFRDANRPFDERLAAWAAVFSDLDGLLKLELVSVPGDPLHHLRDDLFAMEGRSALSRALHANFVSYLPDDLLVKTDRCTMANALEARSPFLDRDLIEYVAQLPDDYKLRGRESKSILREAFADLIPASVQRRRKMGFGVPLGAWFRGPLKSYVRDLLLDPNAKYRDYLNAAFVEQLVSRQIDGTAHAAPQVGRIMAFQ